MPTYTYKCKECDVDIEVLQKIDAEEAECAICGKKMKKTVPKINFILSGSGFYKTDYAKGKK